MCLPGDTVRIAVELEKPVAVDSGTRFAVREEGRPLAPESSRTGGGDLGHDPADARPGFAL